VNTVNNGINNNTNQTKAAASSASYNQSYNGKAKQESTTVNHSLANTIGRITEENPKRIKAPGGTIDLSRKTTKDIPSMNAASVNGATDLAARIAAIEKIEAESIANLTCGACGAKAIERRLTCASCGQYFETGVEKNIWDPLAKIGALTSGGLGSRLDSSNVHDQEKQALRNYMFKRLLAKTIDVAIVTSALGLELVSFFGLAKAFLPIPGAAYLMLQFFHVGMPIIAVLTVLGYQAAFEASPVQASLGKFWLNLYVTNTDGENVRAEQVVCKTVLSLLPIMALVAVYGYFYNTHLRHGMHLDAPTASVLAMTSLGCIVTFAALHIMMGSAKKRQTVPDLVTGCVVRER
jgi:uncharacterized RDD family membrane protein YckC/ribosomal protein L37AE/L43A